MFLDIAISGIAPFELAIAAATTEFTDLQPLWDSIHPKLTTLAAEVFASEGGVGDVEKWADLAESTIAQRGSAIRYPGQGHTTTPAPSLLR